MRKKLLLITAAVFCLSISYGFASEKTNIQPKIKVSGFTCFHRPANKQQIKKAYIMYAFFISDKFIHIQLRQSILSEALFLPVYF